ncbi:neurabin-1 [Trichonephila clavata]|uniref:Neurabin-1 n=1 Tax=Trichonephila clavata TaxID=2740835 RepID=A0A8X6GZK7_TRICU|nr:neurabin-1 [Trichonephila clavata]
MADVRAEILAASRSRTGWLEGSVQTTESQPFVSKVKSSFEEKNINQDNKLASNASKSEAVRRLGSKVSSIATLFQSFSPHRTDCPKPCNVPAVNKGLNKSVQKAAVQDQENREIDSEDTSSPRSENESHQKRFNNARAIFEQLGDKSKTSDKSTEHSKNQCSNVLDSSSSKYAQERGRIPSFSSQFSSQSSPEEESHSLISCQTYSTHQTITQSIQDTKSGIERSRPDNLCSTSSVRASENSKLECTQNFAQNSPIYEEIPGLVRDDSEYCNNLTSKVFGHYESITKSEEDKNANTTKSYSELLTQPISNSDPSSDPSFPIYAKVIKKRSKHSSNFSNVEQVTVVTTDDSKPNSTLNSDAQNIENIDKKSTLDSSWESINVPECIPWKKKVISNSSGQNVIGSIYYFSLILRIFFSMMV